MKTTLLPLLLLLATLPAFAVERIWDGGGPNVLLSVASNWAGDTAPVTGDNLTFPAISGTLSRALQNVSPLGSINFSGLKFSSDGYLIGGTGLPLTGPVLALNDATITASLQLNANCLFSAQNSAFLELKAINIGTHDLHLQSNTAPNVVTQGVFIDGVISGSGLIQVSSDGLTQILGANTFTGPLRVNNGAVLRAVGDSALGSTANGTTVIAGGLLMASGNIAEPILCAGAADLFGTFTGDFVTQSGTLRVGSTLMVDGLISGTGGLRMEGSGDFSGTVTLNRPGGNTWTGGLQVDEGRVLLSATSGQNAVSEGPITLGGLTTFLHRASLLWDADHQLPDTMDIIVETDGLVDMDQHSETIRDLSVTGGCEVFPGQLTLSGNLSCVGNDDPAEIRTHITGETSILRTSAAVSTWDIANGAAAHDLRVSSRVGGTLPGNVIVKTGAGTLVMDGFSLPAKLRIEQGRVQITGTAFSNNDQFAIELNGAAALLTGFGDVASITSMAAGGFLSPGGVSDQGVSNPTGSIRVEGTVVLNPATTFTCELKDDAASGGFDRLSSTVAAATVNLGNAALTVGLLPGFSANAIGTQFKIVDNAGTDAVIGTFAGKPEAFIISVAGRTLRINYNAGDGNDVVLTLVSATGNTRTWDGGGANPSWTNAANWAGDVAPVAGDSLIFPAGAARLRNNDNNFAAGTLFNSIVVQAPGYLLEGNAVQLNDGLHFQPADRTPTTGTVTVGLDNVTAAQDSAFTCDGGTGELVLSRLDTGGRALGFDAGALAGIVVNDILSGAGTLTKTGTGSLTLTAANTFTAPLTVEEGTVHVEDSNALGASTANTKVLAGAVLALRGATALSIAEPLDLRGSLTSTGAAHLWSGGIIPNGIPVISVSANSLALSGLISGGHGLRKTGNGTLRFTGGVHNTFFGGLFMDAGTTNFAKTAGRNVTAGPLTLGSAATHAQLVFENNDQIQDNLTLTIAHPASIVQLADKTETIANLVMTGGLINMSTGTLTLTGGVTTLASSTPAGFTGHITHTGLTSHLWNIADGAAVPDAQVNAIVTVPAGSFLDKTGAGRADFTQSNVVSRFYVSGGILNVTAANPNSEVQLAGGTLGGTGSVLAITGDGGTVAPGLSPGRLISNGATLSGGDTLRMEINGPAPATEYDQLTLTGPWSVEGATLALTVSSAPAPGLQFLIINGPGQRTGGGFAGLPEGAVINAAPAAFRINYQSSSVTLTALAPIPVPQITSVDYSEGTGPGGQDQVTLTGTAAPFAVLNLEASTDLITWATLQSIAATGAGELGVTINQTPGISRRYFRLQP